MISLYLSPPMRETVWVLGAFNTEIARVAETVSEPHIGAIRLKWWAEVLEHIAADEAVKDHPVAHALAGLNLPLEPLMQMIEARERDLLKGAVFADIAALDEYATVTGSAMWLPLAKDEISKKFLRQLGQLWALQGMLRATGIHLKQGRTMIPRKVLAAHEVSEESLLNSSAPVEALLHMIESLNARLDPALASLHADFTSLPEELRPFGLAAGLVQRHRLQLAQQPQIALMLNAGQHKLSTQLHLMKGSWKKYEF
jgi:phytoene/squalene synthetase